MISQGGEHLEIEIEEDINKAIDARQMEVNALFAMLEEAEKLQENELYKSYIEKLTMEYQKLFNEAINAKKPKKMFKKMKIMKGIAFAMESMKEIVAKINNDKEIILTEITNLEGELS